MSQKRKPNDKRATTGWTWSGTAAEDNDAEAISHEILSDRPDLLPSVARIMDAELDADGRQRALTLFRDALHSPGDVHRDPRVAIEHCQVDGAGR